MGGAGVGDARACGVVLRVMENGSTHARGWRRGGSVQMASEGNGSRVLGCGGFGGRLAGPFGPHQCSCGHLRLLASRGTTEAP